MCRAELTVCYQANAKFLLGVLLTLGAGSSILKRAKTGNCLGKFLPRHVSLHYTCLLGNLTM